MAFFEELGRKAKDVAAVAADKARTGGCRRG